MVIVDDNSVCRKVLEKFARQEGHDTLCFEDGLAFLDYYHERLQGNADALRTITVVLMDMGMPRMDGIEVVKQIRAVEAVHTLPICCMSGFSDKKQVDRAIAAGFNDYFVKPFSHPQIAEVLQRFEFESTNS